MAIKSWVMREGWMDEGGAGRRGGAAAVRALLADLMTAQTRALSRAEDQRSWLRAARKRGAPSATALQT